MSIETIRAEFDIPRLQAFKNYTKAHPPVHVMIAAYLGITTESVPAGNTEDVYKRQEAELKQLLAQIPQTNGK